MKNKRIIDAIGNIDEELILGADAMPVKVQKPYLKFGAIAASFVVLIAAAICLPMMLKGDDASGNVPDIQKPTDNITVDKGQSNMFYLEELNARYKEDDVIDVEESGYIEWSWSELSDCERYTTMYYKGKEYNSRNRKISAELLGKCLGEFEIYGYEYDISTDGYLKHITNLELYEVKDVSSGVIIAVNFDGEYYIYFGRDAEQPATLGDFMDLVGFEENIRLQNYTLYYGKEKDGHYRIPLDDKVMEILRTCASAPIVQEDVSLDIIGSEYVSFTVTSEALGIYKKAFYVSALGYVYTNILEYGYAYEIGVRNAAKLIMLIKGSGSEKCEMEPYMYYLCGTVTEVGDGYIKVDDSIMCKDASDGMVFVVDTNEPDCRRYVEYGYLEVGDVVRVSFEGRIQVDLNNNNHIAGAVEISVGKLIDGDVLIEE